MKTVLLALAFLAVGAQEKPPRALDLLDASGQQYEKAGNGWAVKFSGNNQKEIRVSVVQTENLIVLVTLLALKDEIRDASALNQELLKKNDDYDLVKATIDDDGDYLLRMDLPPAGHDGKSFNAQLVQIATATDLLKPLIDKFRK